jgi:hypothetical protein
MSASVRPQFTSGRSVEDRTWTRSGITMNSSKLGGFKGSGTAGSSPNVVRQGPQTRIKASVRRKPEGTAVLRSKAG